MTKIKTPEFLKPAPPLRSIALTRLEQFCDDPARDAHGGTNVVAVLLYDRDSGFELSVQDGGVAYQVVNDDERPARFRTIEAALRVLLELPRIDIEIRLRSPQ